MLRGSSAHAESATSQRSQQGTEGAACASTAQLPHCAPVLEAGSLSGHSNIFPGHLFYTRPPKETECQDLHLQINTENAERSTSPGSISKRRPPASTGIEDQTSPPMGALRDRAGLETGDAGPSWPCTHSQTVLPSASRQVSPRGNCPQQLYSQTLHSGHSASGNPSKVSCGIPRVLDQVSGRPRPLQGL